MVSLLQVRQHRPLPGILTRNSPTHRPNRCERRTAAATPTVSYAPNRPKRVPRGADREAIACKHHEESSGASIDKFSYELP